MKKRTGEGDGCAVIVLLVVCIWIMLDLWDIKQIIVKAFPDAAKQVQLEREAK